MKKWFMLWLHSANKDAYAIHQHFYRSYSKTTGMIVTAFLGTLAAIFQSAGGFIPGVGYLISPLATAPIILSTIFSIRSGSLAYLLSIVLLMIIQPSEIIIFPFTTGLMGLGIGAGFVFLNKRITILALASFLLFAGMTFLLYGLRFPLLGPSIGSSFAIKNIIYLYLFSFFYCWLWVELSIVSFRKLRIMIGQNFTTDNPLTKTNPNDQATTGAFHPFGTPSSPGEVVRGQLLANGVIYRANPDGSGLEIIADGFRNIFGLGFAPDGKLYATNNGFDFRGSRPIEGDWDTFYEITPGWYGWPDYASGLPVTLRYFKPPGHPQPQFLLLQHPPLAEQPLIRFQPHSATQKFDFCFNESFAPKGEIFFAQFGSAPPITTGELMPVGYRVVRANHLTGQVRDFLINLKPGKGGKGPERPVAVRFSPDGQSLYVLDFGLLGADVATAIPYAETGAVWRITRETSNRVL